jgi:hypothetical protein
MKNISRGGIRYPCKRCKNKKFFDTNVVEMHLLQKTFMEKYLCLFAYGEPYISYETMVERMIDSTFNSNNVHGVIDDSSNHYRSMMMDEMRINQVYTNEYSSVDEERNTYSIRFLELLKDFDEPL